MAVGAVSDRGAEGKSLDNAYEPEITSLWE